MRSAHERNLLYGTQAEVLAFVGKKKVEHSLLRVIDFDETFSEEYERLHVHDIPDMSDRDCCRWISVYGLHDTEVINDLGKTFGINSIILKSILNTRYRPRFQEFDDYTFLSIRLLRFNPEDGTIEDDLLSILVGDGILLTFHEKPIAMFAILRKQFKTAESRLRKGGVGYLVHRILECVIDNYQTTVDEITEKVEKWDGYYTRKPSAEHIDQLVRYMNAVNYLKRNIDPAYEHIFAMDVLNSKFLPDYILPFVEDLRNHFTLVQEHIEHCNYTLQNCLNIYNARTTHKIYSKLSNIPSLLAISVLAVFIGVYLITRL